MDGLNENAPLPAAKRDRPLRTFLLVSCGLLIGAALFLFVLGFGLRLAGIDPPQIERSAIQEQIDETKDKVNR